jgi:threonine/homoserine/homoserine lactone efflux protein
MTWGTYGAYVLFVLLVLIVPGPDTALVLKNSLAGGRRGGVLTALSPRRSASVPSSSGPSRFS